MEMMQAMLFQGPWTINGMVFKLSHWQKNIQPAFARLSIAAGWLQLHHLPVEYWDGDVLESIIEHIGTVLKIDEHTLSLDNGKFLKVCLEIDLSRPLRRGF